MAALTEEWNAYLEGREPDAKKTDTLNKASTALGVASMTAGYVATGLPATPGSEDAANVIEHVSSGTCVTTTIFER